MTNQDRLREASRLCRMAAQQWRDRADVLEAKARLAEQLDHPDDLDDPLAAYAIADDEDKPKLPIGYYAVAEPGQTGEPSPPCPGEPGYARRWM